MQRLARHAERRRCRRRADRRPADGRRAARCTRIWCVRPVCSVQRSPRAAGALPAARHRCCRLAAVDDGHAHARRCGSRPIGASTLRAAASMRRATARGTARDLARGDLAHQRGHRRSVRPPPSGRECPCRAGARCRRAAARPRRGRARSRPLSSVPRPVARGRVHDQAGRLVRRPARARPRRRRRAAAPRAGRPAFRRRPSSTCDRLARRAPARACRTTCPSTARRRARSAAADSCARTRAPVRQRAVQALAVQANGEAWRRSTSAARLRHRPPRRRDSRVARLRAGAWGGGRYNNPGSIFDSQFGCACPLQIIGLPCAACLAHLSAMLLRRSVRLQHDAEGRPRMERREALRRSPRKRPERATTTRPAAVRTPRRPRRRHVLAQQAQLERAYADVQERRKGRRAGHPRALHEAAPDQPGARLRAVPQGPRQLQRQPRHARLLHEQDLSERDQKAARDSFEAFKQLVERFPHSTYADDARARMNYIVNSLAAYEVHVARYYFSRGAYVAAINRAQAAVDGIPAVAGGRRSAVHPGAVLRRPGHDAAARRRRARAAEELPQQRVPRRERRRRQTASPWWKIW